MTFQDYFGTPIAYDPNTGELVKDSVFTAHAADDVALSTPLLTMDPASGVTIELKSSSVGVLPDFRVPGDLPQVVLKSGSLTTKITSIFGAVLAAGLDPETVAGAKLAATKANEARLAAEAAAATLTPDMIKDAAGQALIENPTVVDEAAAAAAILAQSDAGLARGMYLPRGNPLGLGIAITFEDDTRSWLESDEAGNPTPDSARLIVEKTSALMAPKIGIDTRDNVALPGVAAVIAFEDDSMVATIGHDGSVTWLKSGTGSSLAWLAIGDSTTYGSELTNPTMERWAARLTALTGRSIDTRGMPGSRSAAVSVWTGGRSNAGTVNGGSIPSTGYAEVGGMTTGLWASDVGATDFAVVAVTDDGTRVPGKLGRSPSGGAWYRFYRDDAGGAALSTLRLEMQATLDTTPLLYVGIGTNDIPLIAAGTMTPSQFMQNLAEIIGHWSGPVIYWGFLDRGYAERPGTAAGDAITDLERRIQETYGSRFWPVRQYLSSAQSLVDAKIFQPAFVPTTDDNTAVSVGRIPPSFRAASTDSPHLNVLGNQLQARFMHRNLIMRGLV